MVTVDVPIIDVDSHVSEPPDLWTSRLPRKLQDHAPHLQPDSHGEERWHVKQEGDHDDGAAHAHEAGDEGADEAEGDQGQRKVKRHTRSPAACALGWPELFRRRDRLAPLARRGAMRHRRRRPAPMIHEAPAATLTPALSAK